MCYCFVFFFSASRVFDESDDECDDEYAESVRVICELKEKVEPAPKITYVHAKRQKRTRNKSIQDRPKRTDDTAVDSGMTTGSSRVTRSAGAAQDKIKLVSTETDDALTGDEIEILVEDADEQNCEYEYIIADPNEEFNEIEELNMDDDDKPMEDIPAASNDLDELVDEDQLEDVGKHEALDDDDEDADETEDTEDMGRLRIEIISDFSAFSLNRFVLAFNRLLGRRKWRVKSSQITDLTSAGYPEIGGWKKWYDPRRWHRI